MYYDYIYNTKLIATLLQPTNFKTVITSKENEFSKFYLRLETVQVYIEVDKSGSQKILEAVLPLLVERDDLNCLYICKSKLLLACKLYKAKPLEHKLYEAFVTFFREINPYICQRIWFRSLIIF